MLLKEYIAKYADGGKTNPKERQEEAVKFFIDKGLTREQASGIVGNLIQESGSDLRTQAVGDKNLGEGQEAYGIAQWRLDRQNNLRKVRANDYNTLNGQLEFIWWELNNTERGAFDKLLQTKTPRDAAHVFGKYYERPKVVENSRGEYAHKVYNGGDIPTTDTSSPQKQGNNLLTEEDLKTLNISNSEFRETTPQTESEAPMVDFLNFDKLKEIEQARVEQEKKIVQGLDAQMDVQRQIVESQQQQVQNQPQEEMYAGEMDPYNYINIEQYQRGGKVTLQDGEGEEKVDIGSQRYRDLYNAGMIENVSPETGEVLIEMPEVVLGSVKAREPHVEIPVEDLVGEAPEHIKKQMIDERAENITVKETIPYLREDLKVDLGMDPEERDKNLIVTNREYVEPTDGYNENVYKKREDAYKEVVDTFYKKYDPKNVQEVKGIQEELLQKGYNTGEIDGKFGPKTKRAFEQMAADKEIKLSTIDTYYQKGDPNDMAKIKSIQERLADSGFLEKDEVTGNFGDETRAAVLEFNKAKGDMFSTESVQAIKEVESEWCAKGMADVLEDQGVDVVNIGIRGVDAWHMNEKMGGKKGNVSVYNIYDEYGEDFSKVKSAKDLITVTDNIKKKSQTTPEMYKKGDIVGLFYRTSTHMGDKEVLNSKTKNTHVGFVSGFKDGVPIITHNVNGVLRHDPYSKVSTVWINRNTEQKAIAERGIIDTKREIPTNFIQRFEKQIERPLTNKEKEKASTIYNRVEYNAANLPKEIGSNVDSEWLKKATLGVIRLESTLGINSANERSKLDLDRRVVHDIKGTSDRDISYGVGKAKFSDIDSFAKGYFGVHSVEDFKSVEKATDLVSYQLLKNYDVFSDYAKQYPEIGLEEEDIRNMSILAYNQGRDKLLQTGRVRDYRSPKAEVEALRSVFEGNIKDISSTNLKYLEKVGLGALAKTIYEYRNPEGHETYVGRVNRFGEELL